MSNCFLIDWLHGEAIWVRTEFSILWRFPVDHMKKKNIFWYNFIFGPFYILIFIWADTSGLLLWRSRALFFLSKFGLKIFIARAEKKYAYLCRRTVRPFAREIESPPPVLYAYSILVIHRLPSLSDRPDTEYISSKRREKNSIYWTLYLAGYYTNCFLGTNPIFQLDKKRVNTALKSINKTSVWIQYSL